MNSTAPVLKIVECAPTTLSFFTRNELAHRFTMGKQIVYGLPDIGANGRDNQRIALEVGMLTPRGFDGRHDPGGQVQLYSA